MGKILSIVPELCTNCKMCEMACSLIKSGEFSPMKSCIRVIAFPERNSFIPVACFQCKNAPCIKACPVNALFKENDLVVLNTEACTGCGDCVTACPYGAMYFDSSQDKALKCDTCGGDPECVRFCNFKALEYKDAGSTTNTKVMKLARNVMKELKPCIQERKHAI